MSMRFIHITDTHISPEPDFEHYGHRTLANLEVVVDAINALTFPFDFVLHSGDVVEDRSEAGYQAAKRSLRRLRAPVYYVAGNHDDADLLCRVLTGRSAAGGRLDYAWMVNGVQVAVFDTRGVHDPSGTLTGQQLSAVRALCTPDGPPLVICLHHPPLPLDSPWLDQGWVVPQGVAPTMLLEEGPQFLGAIRPARQRIRGVFFGHVHRAYQVVKDGVLFSSAPSVFGQLLTWPDQKDPVPAPHEPGGFCVVTVTAGETIVRQHAVARPAGQP